jgi:hypothetical protein
MEFVFKGGQFVYDQISGFCGIISGIVMWDTGNLQYSVQPKNEDSDKQEPACWIDADFLKLDNARSLEEELWITFDDSVFELVNGAQVKSKKNKFKGTVTAEILWITGCEEYIVTSFSLGEDGKPICNIFPGNELELIVGLFTRKPKPQVKLPTKDKGGPMKHTIRATSL